VCDVAEQEVVEILRRGHAGAAATLARVMGRGPFRRITLCGGDIGRLKFQPPHRDRQCTLSSFFQDDLVRFTAWLDSLDSLARSRHQAQFDEYDRVDGRFELPPVYDFEGQVLDGSHRTRAAYYAYLRSGATNVSLEVICDVAALPM
jgi:hypothetical protein